VKYSNITLKWGITDEPDQLYAWHRECIHGRVNRKNGSVVLLDRARNEKRRWNFFNAWPSKWTGPALNSTSTAIAVESLEITHEEVKKA